MQDQPHAQHGVSCPPAPSWPSGIAARRLPATRAPHACHAPARRDLLCVCLQRRGAGGAAAPPATSAGAQLGALPAGGGCLAGGRQPEGESAAPPAGSSSCPCHASCPPVAAGSLGAPLGLLKPDSAPCTRPTSQRAVAWAPACLPARPAGAAAEGAAPGLHSSVRQGPAAAGRPHAGVPHAAPLPCRAPRASAGASAASLLRGCCLRRLLMAASRRLPRAPACCSSMC